MPLLLLALLLFALPACADEVSSDEVDRLAALLEIGPGDVVADLGAGEGEMAIEIARVVDEGAVYATELPDVLDELRDAVESAGAENVRIIEAKAHETNLPPACCDAVYLRRVYHHFQKPARNTASLFRTVRPGGLVAVIDFEPREGWSAPDGVPESRGGHGMPSALLIEEMRRAGFELLRIERDWPEAMYAALFRRP